MKNRSKKYNYDFKLDSSAPASSRLYLLVVCFMFLSFRLVTSLTGVACANSTVDSDNKLSPSSTPTTIDPNNVNGTELLRAEMSFAGNQNNSKSKDQLMKMIEQIRSFEFERKAPVPEPVVASAKSPVIEPNDIVVDAPEQKETVERKDIPDPSRKYISEGTLQILRDLAQDPKEITNPFELGEILFVSDNLKEAAIFYSEALKRKDPKDVDLSGERAWILFQIGNCLRDNDMPEAARIYKQLLTEYPNSPWVALATARSNIIAWYIKEQPVGLIEQLKRANSDQNDI